MKSAGSFTSLRGIKATGPVGVGVVLASDVLGGGDTGLVADCGKDSIFLPLFDGFDDAAVEVLAPLFATIALSLPADSPVKIALGAVGAARGLLETSISAVSLSSFWRFAAGS